MNIRKHPTLLAILCPLVPLATLKDAQGSHSVPMAGHVAADGPVVLGGIVVGNPADLPEEGDKKFALRMNQTPLDFAEMSTIVIEQWGTDATEADLDRSGRVDGLDLLLLAQIAGPGSP